MAEERPKRGDQTAELSLGDLEPVKARKRSSKRPPPPDAPDAKPPKPPSVPRPPAKKARSKSSRPPAKPSAKSAPPAPKPPPVGRAARKAKKSAPPPPARSPLDTSIEKLLRHCETRLADPKNDAVQSGRLHYELARIYEVHKQDPERAAEHYQASLQHIPDHPAALRGARRSLSQLGRHAPLLALYDAEVRNTKSPAARARLLFEKARTMEEHLRQSSAALEVYREALALEPGSLPILKAIERELRRTRDWPALSSVYEDLANAVTDPGLRAGWIALRARLTETHLNDPSQATALYQAALETDPLSTTALSALKRLSGQRGRWQLLISALRTEYQLVEDRAARVQILTTIANVQRRQLGDAEAAATALDNALELDPHNRVLLEQLANLREAAGKHELAARTLARLVEEIEHPDARGPISFRIGRIYDQELGDRDRAQPWYQRTLLDQPAHAPAANALIAIHRKLGDYQSLIKVLGDRAQALAAADERAQLHHQIGSIYETHLEQPAAAIEAYGRALALVPDHEGAFDALTRLLSRAQRWSELTELYQRAADRAPDATVSNAWLFRLGAIYEDRLQDPNAALAVYERVLKATPEHIGALHAVQRAAAGAGKWDRQVATLIREADLTADPGRTHDLRHRAAVLTADRLNEPSKAVHDLRRILSDDPQHSDTLSTLTRLLSESGKWEELLEVQRAQVAINESLAHRRAILMDIATVQTAQLGRPEQAANTLREVLALDANYGPARTALAHALRQAGDHAGLADELEGALDMIEAPLDKARAAVELGRLVEEELADSERALKAYEQALVAAPLYRPAIDARERILTAAEDWSALVRALQQEAKLAKDPFLRLHAALRAATVLAEQQGAIGPALEAFRPVFELQPDHVGALLSVEEIYTRAHEPDGLGATYEKMADVLRDPDAQLAMLVELARVNANNPERLHGVFRQILKLSPDDPSALEALVQHARTQDDKTHLLALEARLAATSTEPSLAAFHQIRVGEILLRSGDASGALAAFRAALALDPKDLAATRGLTEAARATGDADALGHAARYEDAVTQDRTVAVGLLLEAAAIRRDQADLDGAARDYGRALELDADSEPAADGLRAVLVAKGDIAKLGELLSRAAHAASTPARASALHLATAQLHAEHLRDLASAVAAAERAHAQTPDDPHVLFRLATYRERNGQWEDAVAALTMLLPKAKDEILVDAHLRLASIAADRLQDPARAAKSLRAVLARDPDRPEAIARLIGIEKRGSRTEEALRLAQRLHEIAPDADTRRTALAELAELEYQRRNYAAAAQAALTAIDEVGPETTAAKVYRKMIGSAPEHANWDAYAEALTAHATRANREGQPAAAAYRELAEVYASAHNRPDRAVAVLRGATDACPADTEISLALVGALTELKSHDAALTELRRIAEFDVDNPALWRSMADQMRALGEAEGAAVVLSPLVALGLATEAEQRLVTSRPGRKADPPPGILNASGLKQLSDRAALDATATVLTNASADVFNKLEGLDYDQYGITKRDRLRPGDPHPIRAYADRLATIFTVPDYDVFMSPRPMRSALLVAANPPALLVPESIESSSDAELTFHLCRPLALLSRGLHVIDALPDHRVAAILVATARHFDPTFVGPEDLNEDPDLQPVTKAIGWMNRGRIQEAASTFIATPTRDLLEWVVDVRRVANRAALLVADDLNVALRVLGETVGPDNAATDLVRFWVSDPAMRFRRAVAQQVA